MVDVCTDDPTELPVDRDGIKDGNAASRMENISIDANIIYLTEANSTVDSFIMCENEKSLILNMSSNHLRWLIALIE